MRTSRLAENAYDRPSKNNYNNFDYMPQQNNYHTLHNGGHPSQNYRYSVDSHNHQYRDLENSERTNMRYQ